MYEKALENVEALVYVADENFTPLYLNSTGFEAFEGLNFDSIEDLSPEVMYQMGVFSKEQLQDVRELYEGLDPGQASSVNMGEITVPGGDTVCAYASVTALETGGYVGVIKDVSELEAAKERAEIVASAVGHDMKNKLQLMTGYLDIINEEVDDPEINKYVEKLGEAIDEASDLSDKASEVHKVTKEDHERVIDLNNVFNHVLDDLEDYSEEEFDVYFEHNGSLHVEAGGLVETMFYNIVQNGIEHSGGDRIEIDFEEYDEKVEVYVRDNGEGMPDEVVQRVLRGNESIGTYLVKEIADEYDIEIDIESNESGTEYYLSLPKATS